MESIGEIKYRPKTQVRTCLLVVNVGSSFSFHCQHHDCQPLSTKNYHWITIANTNANTQEHNSANNYQQKKIPTTITIITTGNSANTKVPPPSVTTILQHQYNHHQRQHYQQTNKNNLLTNTQGIRPTRVELSACSGVLLGIPPKNSFISAIGLAVTQCLLIGNTSGIPVLGHVICHI